MERLAWNKVLDKYLATQEMHPDEYEALNDIQRTLIHELRRSFSRTEEVVINEIHHSLINK